MKSEKDIDDFKKLLMQAEKVLHDFNELSKKKPNDLVNKFKIEFVNTILKKANGYLRNEFKPFDTFDVFSEDELPFNSDVVLILSQYVGCLENYRSANIQYKNYKNFWIINGKVSKIIAY